MPVARRRAGGVGDIDDFQRCSLAPELSDARRHAVCPHLAQPLAPEDPLQEAQGQLGPGCAYGFSASICGKIEMAADLELKILLKKIKDQLRKVLSLPPLFERIPGPV